MLKDCAGQPELIFIATGSEVELAVAAYEKLTAEGVKARVVSMPSTDAFDKQDAAYRESVLPKAVTARVAVEAGIADYWYKYVGLNGAIVGMTTFGESAPAELPCSKSSASPWKTSWVRLTNCWKTDSALALGSIASKPAPTAKKKLSCIC